MNDVIDSAAGLQAGDALHTARRFRAKVVEATQASHDALLELPVAGLSRADRLRVALRVCEAGRAGELAAHYRTLLQAADDGQAGAPALGALLDYAATLTTEPRRGDRAALLALKDHGFDDAALVAVAQLVGFLSYQMRVVAGLKGMRDSRAATAPTAAAETAASAAPARVIRRNGFTNESLDWRSWLVPVRIDQASALQLEVLDESHAQARASDYYLTLAHQPLMLRHRSQAYNTIMYAPGGLPRAERELGAMVVSVTNGCVYCTSVHAQRYAQLARRDAIVEQLFDDPERAGDTDRERAIVRFSRALTLAPHALVGADIDALRAVGMGTEDVIDLLHASAIFGWANRLMHNLGEPAAQAAAG